MSNAILIIGGSGTGKSSSIRTLNPSETYIVNVLNKSLPFRGWKSKYKCQPGGNLGRTDNIEKITNLMLGISQNRPDIKNIIIDDFHFTMANEFMRRAKEGNYNKFIDIGFNTFSILDHALSLREDITVIFLCHAEVNKKGFSTIKTLGEMTKKYVDVEAKATVILHTIVFDEGEPNERYKFITNINSEYLAKSPDGMFDSLYIPNDLNFVLKQIEKYDNDESEYESEVDSLESKNEESFDSPIEVIEEITI